MPFIMTYILKNYFQLQYEKAKKKVKIITIPF